MQREISTISRIKLDWLSKDIDLSELVPHKYENYVQMKQDIEKLTKGLSGRISFMHIVVECSTKFPWDSIAPESLGNVLQSLASLRRELGLVEPRLDAAAMNACGAFLDKYNTDASGLSAYSAMLKCMNAIFLAIDTAIRTDGYSGCASISSDIDRLAAMRLDILRLAEYSSTKTSDKESITIGISLAQVCLRAEAFRSMAASGKAVPEDKVEFITEGYKEMVSLRKFDSETIASACKFILGVELGAPFQKIIWGDMLLDIEKLSTILIKSTCDKLDREAGKFEKLLVDDDNDGEEDRDNSDERC